MLNKNLQTFKFHTFQLEVFDKDGELWFIAAPLAKFLEYQNPARDIRTNVDEADIQKMYIPTKSNNYVCVNESGLYSLVIRSNKPEAKVFRHWVTHEVLPTIRKHGVYADTAQKLTQLSPEQVYNNLLNLSKKFQSKYPKLTITDSNVLLEKQGDTSDLRYWTDVEKLGLPIIRVINAKVISQIQIEFSFYGWKKFGQEKKIATFEKMAEICKGLSSYNKIRKFAFNKMNAQDTEFVKGFTDLKHAKHIATLMQYGTNSILS